MSVAGLPSNRITTFSIRPWVQVYETLWTNLSNHAVQSLNLQKYNEEPSRQPSPLLKTISTTTSTPQVCLPSGPLPTHLPTHPKPPCTFDPAHVICFHGSKPSFSNLLSGNLLILIIFIFEISITAITIIFLLFFSIFVGLRRHSASIVLEWPLYYMGWSESPYKNNRQNSFTKIFFNAHSNISPSI